MKLVVGEAHSFRLIESHSSHRAHQPSVSETHSPPRGPYSQTRGLSQRSQLLRVLSLLSHCLSACSIQLNGKLDQGIALREERQGREKEPTRAQRAGISCFVPLSRSISIFGFAQWLLFYFHAKC